MNARSHNNTGSQTNSPTSTAWGGIGGDNMHIGDIPGLDDEIRPHPLYHVDAVGGLVAFQIGQTEYKVLLKYFQGSEFFMEMLSKGQKKRDSVGGPHEIQSIMPLGEVSNYEFEQLLWLFDRWAYERAPDFDFERWSAILHLSTKWKFNDIRGQAITTISKETIDPVELIALARKCDVPQWWKAAFAQLIDRPLFLTFGESSSLGLETALKIAELREKRRASQRTPLSFVFEKVVKSNDDAPSLVERGFDEGGQPIWMS